MIPKTLYLLLLKKLDLDQIAFFDHNLWSGMAAPGVHPAKARQIAANIAGDRDHASASSEGRLGAALGA